MAIYCHESRILSFLALESVAKIGEGYSRCFKIKGRQLLLVNSGGITRLIPVECPHENYSLKKAKLCDGEIRCRKHGIAFRLDSGEAVGGEVVSQVPSLKSIELVERDGVIGVLSE